MEFAHLIDNCGDEVKSVSKASEIIIRPATVSDIDEICHVCDLAWNGIWQGSPDMFKHRINAFPEYGVLLGLVNDSIEGYVSIQVTDNETTLASTWNEATDAGRFTRTHDIRKEWIHGVGLALTPFGSSHNLAGKLIDHLNEFMIATGKKGARFITRMPGYYRKPELAPESYAKATRNSRASIDPEILLMQRYKFHVTNPPLIFRNYVEGGGDPNSLGCSVLVERLNPYWK